MRQSTLKQPSTGAWRKPVIWILVLLPLVVIFSSITWLAVAQPGCVSCHSKDAEFAAATQRAPHSGVECVDCHVPPAAVDRFAFGFRQLFHMTIPLMDGEGRDWETVDNTQCLSCHKEINEKVASSNGYRIDHSTCATDKECVDCHSDVAHDGATKWVRAYDMEACLQCHVSEASTKCDTCHVEKDRAIRVATGTFAITHGKEWRKTHGMGNMTNCSVCHTAAKCEKCHGIGLPHDKEFRDQHGTVSADRRAKCSSCHDNNFCADCHGLQMPHPRRFTRNHATLAERNPDLCKRCHAEPDCTECHVKHVHPGGAVDVPTYPPGAPGNGGE